MLCDYNCTNGSNNEPKEFRKQDLIHLVVDDAFEERAK